MESTFGVTIISILALRNQFFEYVRDTGMPWSTTVYVPGSFRNNYEADSSFFLQKRLVKHFDILKARGWSGHFVSSLAPVEQERKLTMPPSSAAHGGQYDTKYMAFK